MPRRLSFAVGSAGMSIAAVPDSSSFGDLVRYWRRIRGMSQLDLASAAMTTPRHMSFLETGRSQASREMVLRLATALGVPLRDRNGLLLAAGFAPLYTDHDLDDPAVERVNAAIDRILTAHDPLPAVAPEPTMGRAAHQPAAQHASSPGCSLRIRSPKRRTSFDSCSNPDPCAPRSRTGTTSRPALLERARREAVGGVLDHDTAEFVEQLRIRARCGDIRRGATGRRTARTGHRRPFQRGRHDAPSGSRSSRRSERRSTSPRRSYASRRSSPPMITPSTTGSR